MGDFHSSDGILARVRWTDGRLQVRSSQRYVLPSERRLHSKGFTGAELHTDGTLIVCGFNALYRLDPDERSLEPWLVRDDFNDLHDVTIMGQGQARRIIVVNTGLDRIDIFGTNRALLNRLPLAPLTPRRQRDDSDPYFDDLAASTRPLHLRKLRDSIHPNSVLPLGKQLWVSRFSDHAITLVSNESSGIQVPGCPHDLKLWQQRIWFSTTDGRVWSFGPTKQQPSLRCEFDSFASTGLSGWVRGLAMTDELLLLGFTRISRVPRERWADRPFDETATGLLAVDRADHRVLDWLSLDNLGEHPKVFGIYPWRTA